MRYIITEKGMTLTASDGERQCLKAIREEEPDRWGTSRLESEVIEPLICNSDLMYILPGETGDLTEAPMYGFWAPEMSKQDIENTPHFAKNLIGVDSGCPIIARWAFMSYQLRSFLDDLADKGEAFFEGGFAGDKFNPFKHCLTASGESVPALY